MKQFFVLAALIDGTPISIEVGSTVLLTNLDHPFRVVGIDGGMIDMRRVQGDLLESGTPFRSDVAHLRIDEVANPGKVLDARRKVA